MTGVSNIPVKRDQVTGLFSSGMFKGVIFIYAHKAISLYI